MPTCRVYLFTYKRNELLKRAIGSLQNQTFKDWICELHNDLPGDKFPEEYINTLNDERFVMVNHSENLGTTKSFNLAYSGCDEKYASILEDDNWWEPTFLEEMIASMDSNTHLDIAWSNMQIWKENDDHSFSDTGETIWPMEKDLLFSWPQPRQVLGCLHSTGAMLYKGSKANEYLIPDESLSNAVELIRERSFKHPIFLRAKVLANFSRTIESSQSKSAERWIGTLSMMLSSYIMSADDQATEFKNVLKRYRERKPAITHLFFLSICFYIKNPQFITFFNIIDWYKITKWHIANLRTILRIRKYLKGQGTTWEFLKTNTLKLSKDKTT